MQDLHMNLVFSGLFTLGLTVVVFLLVQRVIVSRVESFRRPLAAYAAGQYDVRLPVTHSPDEMGELALAFNRMAEQLARQACEEQARANLRQRAIVEERERIARELHDGLAQVLGYVKNKATAVRLLLRRDQPEAAEKQLAQLEEAAGDLFVDVREAILGLKMTSASDVHLPAMLTAYVHHFSQLCDLPVEVEIAPSIAKLSLAAETELQLLRIVQEALSNVRKHAAASRACVRVTNGGPTLELTVSDDGTGFDSEHARQAGRSHFGLSTMRERAEAIGAEFSLDSQPGAGTQITVRMKTQENALDAHPGRR